MARRMPAAVMAPRHRRVGTALGVVAVGAALSLMLTPLPRPASAAMVRSEAWAGYEANHQTFRQVAAHWVVPALTCSGTTAAGDPDSYVWAGLGPSPSSSERVGVREFCTGRIPAYVAFLEMNSEYEVQGIDPVPGDGISASVSFASGTYRFSLADATQGKSFSLKYRCGAFSFGQGACGRSTAEVIAGMTAPGLAPLADYGTVTFDGIAIADVKGTGEPFRRPALRIGRLVEHHHATVTAARSRLSRRGRRGPRLFGTTPDVTTR